MRNLLYMIFGIKKSSFKTVQSNYKDTHNKVSDLLGALTIKINYYPDHTMAK